MIPRLTAIEQFNFACAKTLDEERYGDWPHFFAAESRYEILSRENVMQGLPAPLMSCYSHGMIKDRVAMLVKSTLTYRRMYLKHFISNVHIVSEDARQIRASANVLLMQSTLEGVSSICAVGSYDDVFIEEDGALKLFSRRVVLDSFGIDTMLAVPI